MQSDNIMSDLPLNRNQPMAQAHLKPATECAFVSCHGSSFPLISLYMILQWET